MQVRFKPKHITTEKAGIIKTEYKAYLMPFLNFFFDSVKISLICDHEPTKHCYVVSVQKVEKRPYIIMLGCLHKVLPLFPPNLGTTGYSP